MYSHKLMPAMKSTIVLVAVTLLCCFDVRADVYKCTDDDGNLVFQQTPCVKRESEKVRTQGRAASAMDCSHANKFAVTAARLMRSGLRSDQVFDRYGGLDSLSEGSVGVINYVYRFHADDSVSVERIAALAQAKCKAQSFGDASCEALPLTFTESLGGCDAGDSDDAGVQSVAPPVGQPEATTTPSASRVSSVATNERSQEIVQRCKKKYRDAIDQIDAEMRHGYSSGQGEVYRQRLRVLTEQLRGC